MAPSVLQNGGFILGLLGAAALIAATAMNNWSVKDRQGDVVTSVYTYKGLWQDCETASSGFTECRPLYGILGFSGPMMKRVAKFKEVLTKVGYEKVLVEIQAFFSKDKAGGFYGAEMSLIWLHGIHDDMRHIGSFQAVRALMIVGVVLSVLGAVISVFSLTCISMISMEDTTKAKMSLTAGIMFITAGVCGIAGASIYASQIVASFRMSTNYGGNMLGGMGGGMGGMGGGMGGMGGGMGGMPTYTFGPALFVGWIGGGVLIIGGILKSLAFKELVKDEKPSYPGVVYKPQTRTKTDLSDHHSEGAKKDQNYV